MEISLNLKSGGKLTLNTADIVEYTPTRKGSMVLYMTDGTHRTADVYEAPSRIKHMLGDTNE